MSDSLLYNPSSSSTISSVSSSCDETHSDSGDCGSDTIVVIQPPHGQKRKYAEQNITIYVPSISISGQDLDYCFIATLNSTDSAEAALKAVQQAVIEFLQNFYCPGSESIEALTQASTTTTQALQECLNDIGHDMDLSINFVVKEIHIGLVQVATAETDADKLKDDYVPLVSPEVWKQTEISGMPFTVKKTKFFTSVEPRNV
jgi:hypothetical protein